MDIHSCFFESYCWSSTITWASCRENYEPGQFWTGQHYGSLFFYKITFLTFFSKVRNVLLWSPFQVLNSDFASVMDGDDEGLCTYDVFIYNKCIERVDQILRISALRLAAVHTEKYLPLVCGIRQFLRLRSNIVPVEPPNW